MPTPGYWLECSRALSMSVQSKDDVLGSAEGLHQLTSNLDNNIKRRGGSVDFSNRLTQATVFYCLPPLAEAVDKRALLFFFFFKSSLPFFCILSLRVETKTNRQFCNDPGTMCSTAMVTSEGSMI